MNFWGLSFDSVTIIMLVIALGLAVDYSAHIGRAYMEMQGTPDERLKGCLSNMGVAVFNGGDLGFRIQDLGFRIQDLGFRV